MTDSPVGAVGRKWVQEETQGKSTAKGQSHREDRKQEFFWYKYVPQILHGNYSDAFFKACLSEVHVQRNILFFTC